MPNDAPSAGRSSLREFAAGLQILYREAGKPDYRELRRRTGYGRTVLSEALNGSRLPTWPVTQALVQALDADPEVWRSRWAETCHALAADPRAAAAGSADEPTVALAGVATEPGPGMPATAPGSSPPGHPPSPAAAGGRRWRWPVLSAVVVGLVLVAMLAAWAAARRGATDRQAAGPVASAPSAAPPSAAPTSRPPSAAPTRRAPAANDPGTGIANGLCIRVIAKDVRVFTSAKGSKLAASWPKETRFWSDPQTNTHRRYRTVLRDGRPAWVTANPLYTAPGVGCP